LFIWFCLKERKEEKESGKAQHKIIFQARFSWKNEQKKSKKINRIFYQGEPTPQQSS